MNKFVHLIPLLRQYFISRPIFKKSFFNTGWLILDRIFRMSLGLIVSVLVARHLGPDKFGILSYTLSIVAFMGTFVYLGLSGLVVRDIVRFPEENEIILGTTFALKFTGSLLAFFGILCFVQFIHTFDDLESIVLLILSLSLFARPFETIDFWFQSQVQSKYTVIAKSSAFFLAALLKILLVFLGASIVSFAICSSLEIIVASVFLVFIYHYNGFSVFLWKVRITKAKQLIGQSWIIILSGFLAMINLKVDQIMLRWFSGTNEVGIYSVAVTFSEVWYFLPTFIVMSIYPRLIDLRKNQPLLYEKKLQQVFDILFLLAALVAILVSSMAGYLIPVLYTDAFSGASAILIIHVWAGIFMFMRALFSKWVLMEDALFFSLLSHGSGALINILLNLFLIPKFAGKGAAVATLFSYAVSSYFFLFLYPKTKPLAQKMSKSFIFPFRLIIYRNKIWT